jgi:ABC-2 type transport system permease protein
MSFLRVLIAGGTTSYRALFGWISPWLFVPMLVVYPVFQILFFAYLGRSAHVASDAFFLIGNSFVGAAIAGLFGMGQSIAGERRFQTLPLVLGSPASRLALFLGRAIPTVANGFFVAAVSFALGAWILGVHVGAAELGGIAVALLASCAACAALGLCIGALGFRARSISVFADGVGAVLLVVSGANVPFDRLPGAVRAIASYIPLTHGIAAARRVAGGASLGSVDGQLLRELAVAAAYLAVGLALLRLFEWDGRVTGSLDRY